MARLFASHLFFTATTEMKTMDSNEIAELTFQRMKQLSTKSRYDALKVAQICSLC
jgi:hypothetical protein